MASEQQQRGNVPAEWRVDRRRARPLRHQRLRERQPVGRLGRHRVRHRVRRLRDSHHRRPRELQQLVAAALPAQAPTR